MLKLGDLRLFNFIKRFGYTKAYKEATIEDIRKWLINIYGYRLNVRKTSQNWLYYVFDVRERRYCVYACSSAFYNSEYKAWIAAIYYILQFCDLRFRNV